MFFKNQEQKTAFNGKVLHEFDSFIQKQIASHDSKPVLFIISEAHNKSWHHEQEMQAIERVAKYFSKGQLALFLELDVSRYQVEMLTSFFNITPTWGNIARQAKKLGYCIEPVDTNTRIFPVCGHVLLPALFNWLLIQCLKILTPEMIHFFIPVIAGIAAFYISCFIIDRYEYPNIMPEGMKFRDQGMVNNILSTTFDCGILIVGTNHTTHVMELLAETKKFSLISIALEENYSQMVSTASDIPLFQAM